MFLEHPVKLPQMTTIVTTPPPFQGHLGGIRDSKLD